MPPAAFRGRCLLETAEVATSTELLAGVHRRDNDADLRALGRRSLAYRGHCPWSDAGRPYDVRAAEFGNVASTEVLAVLVSPVRWSGDCQTPERAHSAIA